MIFHDNLFIREKIGDPRLAAVCKLLTRSVARPIDLPHLIVAAIAARDEGITDVFTSAVKENAEELESLIKSAFVEEETAADLGREDFSSESADVFRELEQVLGTEGSMLDELSLELLLHFVLQRPIDSSDPLNDVVDISVLKKKVAEKVGAGMATAAVGQLFSSGVNAFVSAIQEAQKSEESSQRETEAEESAGWPIDRPFIPCANIAPTVDMTHRVHTSGLLENASPYEHDEHFQRLFERIARIMHRRSCRNVALAGDRGVAKMTIVTELARRAAQEQNRHLSRKRFVYVDCRHTYADQSRERLLALLDSVASACANCSGKEDESSQCINQSDLVLCIDGFADLLQSDRGQNNQATLLGILAQVPLQLIAMLNTQEYAELIGDDVEMLEQFEQVEVQEPDVPTGVELVKRFASGLEETFAVQIDDAAIERAVVLSDNYILNERLPSKAVKILHRACEDIDYERSEFGDTEKTVKENHIVRIVSEFSGVPEETLQGVSTGSEFEKNLGEEVLGQQHAVSEVARELGLIKAGLTDPDKPASVMLFLGQTGTGKTEMAKALANFYSASKRLRTYTLGNFVEPHSVAGIIGVPPGYVGHDQGGRLVHDLQSDPYCVFLLDEADKAHPDVLQPFLNLFDEGWVRDQRGVKAYADKSIFVLTSNVGQKMISEMAKQGKSIEEMTNRMKEAVAQIRHGKSNRPVFAPEFLARIKRTIVFKPLDELAMSGICNKLVRQMTRVWKEKRQKALIVDDAVTNLIAQQANAKNSKSEGREGGRIVRKLLADLVESEIQSTIMNRPNDYRQCRTVNVDLDGETPTEENGDGSEPSIRVSFAD